jgi:predicted transcriptional regulator
VPIGIVSDEDFQRELQNITRPNPPAPAGVTTPVVPNSTALTEIVTLDRPGRKDGHTNVPDSLRKIIGEDAVINGRQSALGLAGMFGISPSSVSAYAKGATSTASYHQPKESIISHINKSRRRAITKAQKTLNGALSAITQEKLDYTDAKDLSAIAKDMSVVIKNLEPAPTAQSDNSNQPQFTIFAPTFRDERSFDSIVVKE